MPCLESLDCGGNSAIGPAGWEALATAMPQMSALRILYAGACGMDDTGASALAAGLPHAQALKTLYLQYNSIANAGARSLTKALPCCLKLTNLELFGNRYDHREKGLLDAAGGTNVHINHEDPDDSSSEPD